MFNLIFVTISLSTSTIVDINRSPERYEAARCQYLATSSNERGKSWLERMQPGHENYEVVAACIPVGQSVDDFLASLN